jgi:hypothetical protein
MACSSGNRFRGNALRYISQHLSDGSEAIRRDTA